MSGQVYSEPFAQVPEWLIDSEVSDRAIRVFAILHRHSDKDGRAFPGRTKLAARARCSTASLDRALNELRLAGAIHSQHRTANGGVIGNDYWLWPALPSSLVSTPSLTGDATPGRVGEATLASRVTQQKEREPVNESQLERKPENAPAVRGDEIAFAEFWTAYPRKEAKGAARAAYYRALRKATVIEIHEGALRYRADPNRDPAFTAHPATWLNQERWNDDPLPARNGRATPTATQQRTERNMQALGAFIHDEQKALPC